jgi:hypothetical protein
MLPLANFTDDVMPVLALLAMVMIPIVAMLTRHQQKMALLFRQPVATNHEDSMARLCAEVRELRAQVNQQTLLLDNLADTNRRLTSALEARKIEERLSN